MRVFPNYLLVQTLTDYLLRAETNVARLKVVAETLSDYFLDKMVLKGLPETFKYFSTVMMQQNIDKMNFLKFKTVLRNFEEKLEGS